MPTFQSTPQFEHGLPESTGILVVNLGTPDATTTSAVRRFLKQFLWDARVVEYPRLLWWLILNLVVLRIRPSRSAAAYKKIWTDRGSPLLVFSQKIVDKLRGQLASRRDEELQVELAMTYGEPSISAAIDRLLENGARRILILPLYPQYSGTTTASVFDAVARKLARIRWIPETRFVNDYCDAAGYIEALAQSVRDDRAEHGSGDLLLMSFHGIPKNNLLRGDPYHCQCQKTARLLAEALRLGDDEWRLTFQSRVGREEWLSPYTDETISALGKQGLSRLDVVCPGFSADCLETLEEIAMQNAETFTASGGNTLHYIPALNARDDHIDFLATLVEQHISDWSNNNPNNAARRRAVQERAKALGAAM